MKHLNKVISIVLATGMACSCANVLEQTPTNQVTDAQLWQDEYMLESHLAELYAMSVFMVGDAVALYGQSPLNVDFGISDNPGAWAVHMGVSAQGEGPVHMVTVADEAKYSERGAQTSYTDVKFNGLQTDTYTMRWWSNGYYLNRQLNHFIEAIESSPLSTATVRKAEARFLRAFNYFAMVKRYGGVPLILKETPINASEEEIYPARNSEKECYDFIINECLEIADMPRDCRHPSCQSRRGTCKPLGRPGTGLPRRPLCWQHRPVRHCPVGRSAWFRPCRRQRLLQESGRRLRAYHE